MALVSGLRSLMSKIYSVPHHVQLSPGAHFPEGTLGSLPRGSFPPLALGGLPAICRVRLRQFRAVTVPIRGGCFVGMRLLS